MTINQADTLIKLPVLALRGLVIFPSVALSFDVSRKRSLAALQYAMQHDRMIFAVAQKEVFVDEPTKEDLYTVGCVAKVRQVLKISDEVSKVLIEGVSRAQIGNFEVHNGCAFVETTEMPDRPLKNRPVYIESVMRRIKAQFEKFISVIHGVAPDVVMRVATGDDLGFLTDYIAFHVPAPYDDKQYILEQNNIMTRAKILIEMLDKEREIAQIDRKIGEKTKEAIDENQRDYYLREQMKIISNELYGDDFADEIEEYHMRIESLLADDSVKEKLHSEVNKLAKMPQGSHEGTVVRGYLDTCLELPWSFETKNRIDLTRSAKILDRDISGMEKVKERILELLSVYQLAPDLKGQIICLVGPPGVGKTSIGKTIAECMGRRFARISLGGVHDEAEIRGHRKTYIGAMPGKIINAIKTAGSANPLMLLDEVDKLGNDYRGDPSSALLEVLDPEQNATFVDHYIEIPYDLSRTVFLATANTTDTIPAPLLDRMEVIELSGYTREEKFRIAKRHLVPKQIERHGLSSKMIRFADSSLYCLIDFYTREAGVRKLERGIASLCRKSAKRIAAGETKKIVLKAEDVETMLGKKRYRPERILEQNEIGIINGLAWTSVGGEIMQLEVSV
ncbi:MAG: endopeptidase La, partial [Clostridia bacterium]|nr:endopeptidase La [Clostridia bacterium]